MEKITAILFASACLLMVGCNTVSGFGQDVQKAGQKVEDSAEKKK
jgi:entericidin A